MVCTLVRSALLTGVPPMTAELRVSSVVTSSEGKQGSSIIRLHRRTGYWRDRLIRYRVRIDGHSVGLIAEGESLDFSVSPGDHRIRLRVQLTFTSAEKAVSLEAGQLAEFVCGPGGGPVMTILWPLHIFRPHRYIKLDGPI